MRVEIGSRYVSGPVETNCTHSGMTFPEPRKILWWPFGAQPTCRERMVTGDRLALAGARLVHVLNEAFH
jgi:hypothetical protein